MNSQVTIVVSPRERFSFMRESIESIYTNTEVPFELIYVDGNSPPNCKSYLEEQSVAKGFMLIRSSTYLSPNQARNKAIPHVRTPYIAFIDNDVAVAPSWLDKLLNCAQEVDAAVVCPLTCIGKPLHHTIHLAGGEAHIETFQKPGRTKTKRRVHEKHYFVNRPVAEVQNELHRQLCEFAEFHCMLVRAEIFDQIGLLDEALLSTREHIDFCMTVTNAGEKIYCEPTSVVTYVPGKLEWSDLVFFMLRWSDAWEAASLAHFRVKWNVTEDKYFQKRYSRLGHRRHQAYVRPFVRSLSFGNRPPWLEQWLIAVDRGINRFVTDNYTHSSSPSH